MSNQNLIAGAFMKQRKFSNVFFAIIDSTSYLCLEEGKCKN